MSPISPKVSLPTTFSLFCRTSIKPLLSNSGFIFFIVRHFSLRIHPYLLDQEKAREREVPQAREPVKDLPLFDLAFFGIFEKKGTIP